jgi:hypothetical protein
MASIIPIIVLLLFALSQASVVIADYWLSNWYPIFIAAFDK